jgi:S1-C subfamily serine protease
MRPRAARRVFERRVSDALVPLLLIVGISLSAWSLSAAPKAAAPKSGSGKAAKNRAKSIEADAQQCKKADEALLIYKMFFSDSETTEDEKKEAQPRLEYWEQATKDELVHVGKKWIKKDEADQLKAEADKLVAEAVELLNVKSYSQADAKLEKAAKIYPDHLESLFLLGVGAFLNDDLKGAEKRFAQCLSRAPNHAPLLNNVAVVEVLNKRFDRAVNHWEKAASIDPDNATLVQNLGRFLSDADPAKKKQAAKIDKDRGVKKSKKNDFGHVDKHTLDDATKLYAKLVEHAKVRANPSRGYTILTVFKSKGKEDESSPEESPTVGNGSGFVIADGFILTNRHVVAEADALAIQDPANPSGDPLVGKIAAISKELDLAIIRCEGLNAPPAPANGAEVTRGTEVLALGFPVMDVVGKGLKATRGIVTGLPSKDTGNMMVLDVQTNPGNSGGPLCDRSGRVVGIVTAKTFTERFVQGYGLAIPMRDALPFIGQTIAGFSAAPGDDKPLEWTEVDGRISKSTVLILIKKKRKA